MWASHWIWSSYRGHNFFWHTHKMFNTSITNTTLTESGDPPLCAMWNLMLILTIIILIAALLSNGTVLLIFVIHHHLRNPFTVYLMNQLTASILNMATQNPLNVFTGLYSKWYFGQKMCTMFLYWNYVLQGGVMMSHALVVLNRIWSWPFQSHISIIIPERLP